MRSPQVSSIAIIGARADFGVLSGGGSAQVDAPGGRPGGSEWGKPVYFPSSPLRYIKDQLGKDAVVTYDPGTDLSQSAKTAAAAQVAIVFVQHLAPHHESALVSLLTVQTPLIVVQAEEGMRIEAGDVWVELT